MKLLLTSVGIVPEIAQEFLALLGKKPENAKMVFIPTAANPESDRWYLNKDKINIAQLGITSIKEVDLERETRESLAQKLIGADIVYVEGGNTFYLLKYVRESGFAELIKEFLERGGVYVGVSAGSMIVGPNIETANWKHADRNIIGLEDLTAMNLVPFAIAPHIDETNIAATKAEAAKVSYPVIALSDKQAVFVDEDKIKIIGSSDGMIFNSRGDF
jgi:dipeptidase E